MTALRALAVALLAAAATVALAAPSPSPSTIVVGHTRVSALSPTLVRIEPIGPQGYENRSTFNVVGRESFQATGLPIRVLRTSAAGTWLATSAYHVFIPAGSAAPDAACGAAPLAGTDALKPTRSPTYPQGAYAGDARACCDLCAADSDCAAWTFSNTGRWCFPFAEVAGTVPHPNRTFARSPNHAPLANAYVTTPQGGMLWNASNTGNASLVPGNMLHWPSPLESPAYAFSDYPRFTVPEWGPTPVPAGAAVPPGTESTNGYDFNNNVARDTYVFLLGTNLAGWWSSRKEFLALTGPTPLLPDYAFGVWYTWYNQYTETRAKDEIGNWTKINLPLDVWGLDMNWRHIGANTSSAKERKDSIAVCRSQNASGALPSCRSHFYDQPNTDLLPGLTMGSTNEWFEYLKSIDVRTYFNDHPFPVANQTTPEEVAFR